MQLAGKPAKLGGTLARGLGWLILVGGLTVAALLGVLFASLFPQGYVGVLVGAPMALASLTVGLLLLRGGSQIRASGDAAEREAWFQAASGLAGRHGGIVRATELASALGVPMPTADAFLTELAKTRSDEVSLDVDDAGSVYYRFYRPGTRIPTAWPEQEREQGQGRVSVDAKTPQEEPVAHDYDETENENGARDLRRARRP